MWTEDALVEAETAYRRFLALNLLHPTEQLAVNAVVDEYWHQHILHTLKYAEDCQKIFGFYLHHDPTVGAGGEDEQRQLQETFVVTQRLWQEAFGVPLVQESKVKLDENAGGRQSDTAGESAWRIYAYPKMCGGGVRKFVPITPPRVANPQPPDVSNRRPS